MTTPAYPTKKKRATALALERKRERRESAERWQRLALGIQIDKLHKLGPQKPPEAS